MNLRISLILTVAAWSAGAQAGDTCTNTSTGGCTGNGCVIPFANSGIYLGANTGTQPIYLHSAQGLVGSALILAYFDNNKVLKTSPPDPLPPGTNCGGSARAAVATSGPGGTSSTSNGICRINPDSPNCGNADSTPSNLSYLELGLRTPTTTQDPYLSFKAQPIGWSGISIHQELPLIEFDVLRVDGHYGRVDVTLIVDPGVAPTLHMRSVSDSGAVQSLGDLPLSSTGATPVKLAWGYTTQGRSIRLSNPGSSASALSVFVASVSLMRYGNLGSTYAPPGTQPELQMIDMQIGGWSTATTGTGSGN